MANKKEMGTPKAEQYKEHKVRFKRAMHAECYLECIFIDYAMMEDRLLSILHHLKIADRELGKRGGWAQSPKAKREGYRSALRDKLKLRKDGAMPTIDNISTKVDVLEALATLEVSDSCCNDFEHWLRTDVRDKLEGYGVTELCDELTRWIAQRNDLIHGLFAARAREYDPEVLQFLAEDGMSIAARLDDVSGCMARLMKKYEKNRPVRARKLSK